MNDIQIPLVPSNLGGDFTLGKAEVLSEKEGRGVCRIRNLGKNENLWVKEFENVYFQTLRDGKTLKAIRKATDEDIKKYRVPIWIQDEEWPQCCGHFMVFVGQIDDDHLCAEVPTDAEMWWHDAASFYVFTCPKCLGVQAIGQQF